eukprot:207144-Chlamydomonas_euryale.AAC.8
MNCSQSLRCPVTKLWHALNTGGALHKIAFKAQHLGVRVAVGEAAGRMCGIETRAEGFMTEAVQGMQEGGFEQYTYINRHVLVHVNSHMPALGLQVL